jgi:hypothetical protein
MASGPEPSADSGLDADSIADPIAEPVRDQAPAESEPAPRPAGVAQDWGAAIGAEIAAWGTAGPVDEPRPSTKLQGLEHHDRRRGHFRRFPRGGKPGRRDRSSLEPPANARADSAAEEPEDVEGARDA